MSQSPLNALALANAVVEGESPREFLKRFRPPPGWDRVTGLEHAVGEYSLQDYGIEHNQYWQGVSTVHTDWDEVFTGVGDNPHEAADDAIEQAAMEGWSTDTIVNEMPEQPTVSDEIMGQCKDEARRRIHREDYESDEDYEAAVEEAAEEDYSEGDFELNYYVVLWVRGFRAEDAMQDESLQEVEEPGRAKRFIKGLRRNLPSGWPVFKRWSTFREQPDLKQRRAFYTRHAWRGGQRVEVPKPLKRTRFLKLPTPGEYAVRYHATDVLYYDKDGNVRINTGGWRTNTTMARISRFAPAGWNIHRFRYSWYWYNTNWPEQVRQELWADQRARRRPRSQYWIPVNDGDTILPDGTLKFAQGTATPTGEIQRQQHFPFQEGKYLDKLAWIKRVRAKHKTMKEVKKRMKDLEELDKPDNKKKYRW